jgi:MoCo/4Fe-4S cofactor protein with predicted Tat translocation signal
MKKENQNVWIGIEDKTGDTKFLESDKQEFFELPLAESLSNEKSLDLTASRRDFLKYLGFGIGAATVAAGCDIPIKRAIPYVIKPDEIVPGVATYYASSFVNGGDYCSILVKTREGRPIKIEGNAMSPITKGGTSARTQALVLSLYDTNRFPTGGKVVNGGVEAMDWAALDREIMAKLNGNAQIRIVTNTVMSPATKQVFKAFTDKYPNTKVVSYDPVSSAAMLQANEESFGLRMIPAYEFDKADVIVSFNADFLGTWISPIEYARQYADGRRIKDVKKAKMSRHIQVESGMSMTGSNADNRILVKPSEQGAAIAALHDAIAGKMGQSKSGGPKVNDRAAGQLAKVADSLVAAAGRSLVVCGNNNVGEHLLVNRINDMLGNYGKTLGFANASLQREGSDKDIQDLIKEMEGGRIDAVIVYGANPAYDLPNAEAFKTAFAKVKTKISTALLMDETTNACDYVAPDHHQLESWGDVQPKRGHYSIIQPTIAPLFKTRQAQQSLLTWAGAALNNSSDAPYYDFLKAFWQENLFPQNGTFASFQSFWDSALHDGVAMIPAAELPLTCSVNPTDAAAKLDSPLSGELEISFFEAINMGAGQYNNNPWLQELPDPVTRCVWGNNLSVPIEWKGDKDYTRFKNIGVNNKYGELDVVNLDVNGRSLSVGAIPQFGQMPGTVSMALGYGREVAGRSGQDMGKAVGNNVFPWLSMDKNGNTRYFATAAVSDIVGKDELASVQYHHTMGVTSKDAPGINVDEAVLAYQGALVDRSIIFNSHVDELNTFTEDLKKKRDFYNHLNDKTLYPFDEYKENVYGIGHHWGMYVDLNACIGCGACAVSCMAENNVPVVGKHEVYRHHEMFWMQIDRYYYGDVESPNSVYQPKMCQHCDNAPCENVCPVAATNHSSEGLNQMAYNRCVGTRYCANNCPYKVRRFNWLDYTTADLFPANQPTVNGEEIPFAADNLTRMVLNPDVTVRVRGVIEKCSFCVQRIQTGKLTAKAEMRALRDADVKTACQTACPTGAIIFGDQNNKEGEFSKNAHSPLVYRMLEEVNTQSSVYYTAKINNRDRSLDA